MKILQVIPYFTPSRGGDVNVCYNLSKQLVKHGHEVTVITTDFEFDEGYAQTLEKIGAKVIPFHCIANIKLFLISPGMKKWIKSNVRDFDMIHLHDLRSYQNNIVCSYAMKYEIPYVLHPHGSTPRILAKQGLKWLYDIAFGYRLLKDAGQVIAVSKEEANYDRQMGADERKISVIYNGVDIEHFKNAPSHGRFKQKYGIDGKLILYLGRIHKTKGIDFAIKAFSNIHTKIEQTTFVVAGADDGYKAKLENLVRELNLGERIKFVGALNENDKLSAYADADLFLYTVRYMGGVGIAPLEAILCDTPVIVTAECGEVIKEADCGYLVEYGDLVDLTQKMKGAIESPEAAMKMVERGKKYIMDNLTWDNVVNRIEDIYSKLTVS